jgi:hypothetical protein
MCSFSSSSALPPVFRARRDQKVLLGVGGGGPLHVGLQWPVALDSPLLDSDSITVAVEGQTRYIAPNERMRVQ